jgi:hypothetical protein
MRYRVLYSTLAVALLWATISTPAMAQRGGRGNAAPPAPAPRDADGRILLNTGTGLWQGAFGGIGTFAVIEGEGGGRGNADIDTVPFQPWARGLYIDRQTHELEPHARCKASGVSRQFQTPYGAEILEVSELQRIYIFDVGGPHTFRTIYLDGRDHPTGDDIIRTGYGHSVGWWEGDTLVVDTVGFDTSFWLDRRGFPHTEDLHTVERFTRTDERNMEYEVTIEDPGVLTAPYTASFNMTFSADQELFEYICQQANYAHELMVGDQGDVDRSAPMIP